MTTKKSKEEILNIVEEWQMKILEGRAAEERAMMDPFMRATDALATYLEKLLFLITSM